jgi:phosphohistidine phosphatase
MKRLFLIRHAKSSWSDISLDDIDRPLNKRGKRDAPFMAKLLKEKNIFPELLISSPAKRANSTAVFFAEAFDYPKERIVVKSPIYESSVRDFLDVLQEIEDENRVVFLFGHNPALTLFTTFLSGKDLINIPTCGIAGLKLKVEKWGQINENTCELELFEYPKKYLK